MLARWRERDVFRESLRNREGGPPFVFYEGPPTANGYPGSHHVLARVFKDVFPRYKTMTGHYVERKAGWDSHGLPVEIAVEQKLGFTSKEDIERYGIAEFNAKCREAVLEHLEDWRALTERIAYWVDLDEAYYTFDPGLHRVGLVGAQDDVGPRPALRGPQGRALLRALRHRALLARGRAGLQGRRGPVGLRALPGGASRPARCARATRCSSGRRRPGRSCRTRRWPSIPTSRTCAPPAARCSPRRSSSACSATDAEVADRFPGREMLGAALRAAVPLHPGRGLWPEGPHRAAGRLRQRRGRHGHRPHRDRLRRGRLPAGRRAGARRRQPGAARRHLRRAHRPVRRPLGQGRRPRPDRGPARARPAAARRDAAARLPALLALRHAAALLRQAVVVHPHVGDARPPARGQRDGRLAPAAHQARALRQVAREQRRLGDLARALLGHAAPGLALRERPRRGGRLVRRGRGALRPRAARPAPPVRRRAHVAVRGVRRRDAPRARGDRRLVRLGLDAVRPAPRAVRERGAVPRDVPRRLHLRGDRPDARLVLLADRRLDAAVRPRAVPDRALPRAHRRPAGQEDVEVARQHRRAVGGHPAPRRRRVPLVLPDLQAAVGRLPVLDRDGRRVRAPVPAPALEHVRLLRALRERQRRDRAGRAGDRARPLGDLAAERDDRRGARADGGLRRDARRPGDRRVRRRAVELVRAPLAAALLGRRPGRVRDAQDLPGRGDASCSRRSARSWPTRSTRTSTAASSSVHLCDFPEAGARDEALERRWRWRARRCGSGSPRAGTASSRCASRCAPRSSWRPARSARRSSGCRTIVLDELNVKELRFVSEADELGSYEVKPNYRALGPRFGKQMPQVAAAVAALDPEHVATRCATAGTSASTSTGTTTSSARTTSRSRCSRSRATSSSARARTRSRSSSSSTTSCAARASRARSCTRSRTRARARACRWRTGSSCRWAATGAARRRARPRGLPRAGDARGERRLRRAPRPARRGDHRGPPAADRAVAGRRPQARRPD